MRTRSLCLARGRSTATLALLSLLALAALSTPADARQCGMKPMSPMHWGMPSHRAMPWAKHQKMPYGRGFGAQVKGSSVIAVAKQTGQFGTLLTALEAAGLTALLEGQGPYTVFAPTDTAFKKLPDGALQELLGDKNKLIALLKYHVVPGRVSALQVLENRELTTATGQKLPTADLNVIRADIRARNGVIHVIDNVLLPTG